MVKFNITDFPYEILTHIFQFIPSNIYQLSLTCKLFTDVIKHNKLYITGLVSDIKTFRNLTPYEPHPEQTKMLYFLKKEHRIYNTIQAPMGAGKTTIMLLLALLNQKNTLIIINTHVYTTWIQEIENLGLKLNQDPKKSNVLMFHLKYPKHRNLILNKNPEIHNFKIILTTEFYIRKYCLKHWLSSDSKIIIDEGHLIKKSFFNKLELLRNYSSIFNIYLFSASPINKSNLPTKDVFTCKINNIITKDIPVIKSSIKNNIDVVELLNKKNMLCYKHVIIFTDYPPIIRKGLENKIKLNTKRLAITFSNTAPTILKRWENSENSVLICSYKTCSTGTNFLKTDCAIFLNFGNIALETARQTLGRIRRKNSKHKKIRVFFDSLIHSKQKHINIKSRLNEYYALNLDVEFTKKTEKQIKTILEYLQKDGINYEKLTYEEIRIIFGYEHKYKEINIDKINIPLEKILKYVVL